MGNLNLAGMNHLYIFDEKGRASLYGVGTYIRNIVSICLKCSIPVSVVTLSTKGEVNSLIADSIQYINIPLLRTVDGILYDLEDKDKREEYSLYVITVLQSFVSDKESLIFHLNYTQDYFLADCLKHRWPSGKIVLTVHYFTWCFALFGNVYQLSQIVSKKSEELSDMEKDVIYSSLFEQRLFKLVDNIICLSSFAYQVLQEYYEVPADKISLIPNGQKDNVKRMDKSVLRKKYGIPDNERMILFVGRLDHIKGVEYLIEAFKKIIIQGQFVHLYIIGDGACMKEYLEQCNPYWRWITFCGRLVPEQIADFYKMSDLGVIPSMHEQCSYVAIEMLMYGLPIIGTDSTGLNEMIEDGVNGYKIHLQEEKDRVIFPVEELISRINHCLHAFSLDEYSYQSRILYLQRYTDERMRDKLCQLYAFCFEKKEATQQNSELLS